ncbi:MAG: o-succinylbenzoate synthase [Chitinophagales bacterium]|nr:o-succinylbenzoate synthase [Chitinophagales bacterium]
MKARFEKYTLEFVRPSGTSRGVLWNKNTYFVYVANGEKEVVGECALFEGLSSDDRPEYEEVLQEVCTNISYYFSHGLESLAAYPSIVFGLEQAFLRLKNKSSQCYDNAFSRGERGIPINGLIWMGTEEFMLSQIEEKLAEGFTCLKMKIGAIDFFKEFEILKNLRKRFPVEELELRVDANGAFDVKNAYNRLDELSKLDLHSIEQVIRPKQIDAMALLCRTSPLAIALDEELIGVNTRLERQSLLEQIMPQYIVLKPALVGGFKACDEWIEIAESLGISWWITSALESNVGLEAIAQYTASKNTSAFQGLGTGKLFTNNTPSALFIKEAQLWTKV